MDLTKRARVDSLYEELLSRLPTPLATKLRERFKADEEEFIAAAVKACPTNESSGWAKPSCKRCYGTGYKGTQVSKLHAGYGEKITCNCGEKRYLKWMKNFREEYNMRDNNDTTK